MPALNHGQCKRGFLASGWWFGYVKEPFLFKVKPPNMSLIAMGRSFRAARTEVGSRHPTDRKPSVLPRPAKTGEEVSKNQSKDRPGPDATISR